MEIVIESDPYRPSSTSPAPAPTYLRSPQQQPPPVVSSSNAFYYATLPRGGAGLRAMVEPQHQQPLDGAPLTGSVRRVDKSGLLEISDLEPVPSGHCGTLSRRLERPGLLEAVPEVPDQCHQPHHRSATGLASEELLAAAATARSMVERQHHLLGAETDIVESALLRRRSFAADSQDSQSEAPLPVKKTCSQRVKFALDEGSVAPGSQPVLAPADEPKKSGIGDCLGRLSPRQREQRHQVVTLSNIPDVIEAHGTASGGQGAPPTANGSSSAVLGKPKAGPEGERAEAEGCEHTVIESVEEQSRVVGYKSAGATANNNNPAATGNKVVGAHNDNNIQAVHVIILSEQL